MADRRKQKGCVTILRGLAVAFGLLLVMAGPVLLVYQPDSQAGWATMLAGLIFMEGAREMVVFSEQYDFVISLLLLADHTPYCEIEEEPIEDMYDRFLGQR